MAKSLSQQIADKERELAALKRAEKEAKKAAYPVLGEAVAKLADNAPDLYKQVLSHIDPYVRAKKKRELLGLGPISGAATKAAE